VLTPNEFDRRTEEEKRQKQQLALCPRGLLFSFSCLSLDSFNLRLEAAADTRAQMSNGKKTIHISRELKEGK
jgi:hypothetical protein